MDYLYISPEFPPNYVHFIENLHSLGINVWGMGEADFYQMPENLQSALAWYIQTDLNNADAVQHALDELLMHKNTFGAAGNFDLVESHNEQWLSLEGMINEKYNINGIKNQDLPRLKKKSKMKETFQELVRITRKSEEEYSQEKLCEVRFVPLVGAEGWQKP